MGLFVLDLEDPPTRQSRVNAAIGNLELYLQEAEGVNENDYKHLLVIASNYLEQAINGIPDDEEWLRTKTT